MNLLRRLRRKISVIPVLDNLEKVKVVTYGDVSLANPLDGGLQEGCILLLLV